jgi:RNA polymerase sigma-70 factor (ECF subfamily)
MFLDERDARWERLLQLLTPVHGQAMGTARRLYRSATDGDDLYQEAVLRAFQKLPALREDGAFRSWFFAVLITVHRSRSRRGFWRRFLRLDDVLVSGGQPAGDDAMNWEEDRQRAERASRALASLPAVQREAVVLHDIEGFTMREVAELQRVTVSAVKTRVTRGRARFARCYQRWGIGAQTPAHADSRATARAALAEKCPS